METITKKKLLVLANGFYPSKNRGGPTISVTNLVKSLSSKFDISVITTFREMNTNVNYSEVKEGLNRIFDCNVYYLENETFVKIINLIKTIQPDIIYENSFFSAIHSFSALIYKKYIKQDIKLVLAPRGEFTEEALARKKLKKKLYIYTLKILKLYDDIYVHTTSEYEEEQFHKMNSFKEKKIYNIGNIILGYDKIVRPPKKKNQLKILTIGRIHSIKNIDLAIKYVSNVKGEVIYDVYGPCEDKVYFDKCLKSIDDAPQNVHISFKGQIDNNIVPEIIQQYHLFLSPSKTENFGNTIVEALKSGCPVLIGINTPWRDIEIYGGGYAIEPNNEKMYIEYLQKYVDMNNNEYYEICRKAREYIDKKISNAMLVDEYFHMFNTL